MKSQTHPPDKKTGANPFEIPFLALPFLALIPNTFVVPPLGYEGLATQEFYFACAAAVFAGLGLQRIIKTRRAALEISREDLLTLATLALFILWQVISLAWAPTPYSGSRVRSEEHTSELQSLTNLVCRLLLEKKNERELHGNVRA